MTAKTPKTNELAGKFKFTGPDVIRVNDFVFVPGTEYENLPDNPYIFGLLKQGYFERVSSKKEAGKPDETITN